MLRRRLREFSRLPEKYEDEKKVEVHRNQSSIFKLLELRDRFTPSEILLVAVILRMLVSRNSFTATGVRHLDSPSVQSFSFSSFPCPFPPLTVL